MPLPSPGALQHFLVAAPDPACAFGVGSNTRTVSPALHHLVTCMATLRLSVAELPPQILIPRCHPAPLAPRGSQAGQDTSPLSPGSHHHLLQQCSLCPAQEGFRSPLSRAGCASSTLPGFPAVFWGFSVPLITPSSPWSAEMTQTPSQLEQNRFSWVVEVHWQPLRGVAASCFSDVESFTALGDTVFWGFLMVTKHSAWGKLFLLKNLN